MSKRIKLQHALTLVGGHLCHVLRQVTWIAFLHEQVSIVVLLAAEHFVLIKNRVSVDVGSRVPRDATDGRVIVTTNSSEAIVGEAQ